MNRVGMAGYSEQMLGGNVMVPQQQMKWMDKPAGDASPLACLKSLSSLVVKQVVNITEFVLHMLPQAKFGVFNDKGEQVYYAFEEADQCQRSFCGPKRGFEIHVVDSTNQELARIRREFRCCAGMKWCACIAACSQEITVESPPGTIIGSVSQECSLSRVQYAIKDGNGTVVLKLIGPGCICDGPYACCCDNKFTITSADGEQEVGSIRKRYRGFVEESLSSADTFNIDFPMDLDSKIKMVLLGAVFLIDFAYFSESPQQGHRPAYGHGHPHGYGHAHGYGHGYGHH